MRFRDQGLRFIAFRDQLGLWAQHVRDCRGPTRQGSEFCLGCC